ncbi:MAG: hypothetical protein P4L33_13870 [Capsulimonadaceae bacterium]|nr:hypothetical protein [Capsulimonadaceae bacterium]
MKANTVVAISISLGVILIVCVQSSIFLAGSMNASKLPVVSPTAGVLDEFVATPLAFLVIGLIFGLIAGAKETLRHTLVVGAVIGAVVSLGLTLGLPSLLNYLQSLLWKAGQDVNIGAAAFTETPMRIGGAFLWVAWYVAGAMLGYKIRNRIPADQ